MATLLKMLPETRPDPLAITYSKSRNRAPYRLRSLHRGMICPTGFVPELTMPLCTKDD
ncbi:hypothetical protein [Alteripontixanthobacter muriae]|uniref:hypothetical protein n=1 Tax=Alteripontixanthobacter muriae TaxID=2705546 RepID=UPI001577762E|nr:hypothetical protein [Alteripontixanthobacter muriae]